MGMTTHVVGFKPPNDKWRRMKEAMDACVAAGVEPPHEVLAFFESEKPDESGVSVSQRELESCGAAKAWSEVNLNDMCYGFEIDISKLPADVTVVRVYNSW